MVERVLVTGAGGFIGGHLVKRLVEDGYEVRAVDIKPREEWWQVHEESTHIWDLVDLRDPTNSYMVLLRPKPDWVFHLAANMGGMGHISRYHAEIIRDNTQINVNMLDHARAADVDRFLFSSSACIYPMFKQDVEMPWDTEAALVPLKEEDAIPAFPQGSYGWEKLFMEIRMSYYQQAGWLDTRIVRFHNTYGPHGSWDDGREKAPAALCRKIADAKLKEASDFEVWGTGKAVRSYMHVDDCVEGLMRLMTREYPRPINLGRDREITVDMLATVIMEIAGVELEIQHVEGPVGVGWRNSDNALCEKVLEWTPQIKIEDGLVGTYEWIEQLVKG